MDGPQRIDEGLELLYLLRERGMLETASFLRECAESDPQGLLRDLIRARFVAEDEDGRLVITASGLARAEAIVRRHRLAEVLLQTVLRVGEKETEQTACVFEHILSEEACDRVCAFLGHPTHCPHALPIPPGRCCALTAPREDQVSPLTDMEVGDLCEIVHIRPSHHARLDRLGAYGLIPRALIRLHQKRPTFVVQIDETDLALDADVARDIYVRRKG
ncbi:MAG: metal-dependent transcriptional regulator [Candidatus Eisenbacteria bacterium]|nr:metal-dependent transcriptional regulator [Candidatus Eisenbacteria bacterium]